MSTRYACEHKVCKDVGAPSEVECQGCDCLISYSVPNASVFRTHRKAVVQSLWHRVDSGAWQWMPRLALQSRLGCEHARAMMRFYRRLANGVKLGRWSWARRARAPIRKLPDPRVPLLSCIAEEW